MTVHYNNCLHCTNKNEKNIPCVAYIYDIIIFYDRNLEYKFELTDLRKRSVYLLFG